jgi:hypothetical protein
VDAEDQVFRNQKAAGYLAEAFRFIRGLSNQDAVDGSRPDAHGCRELISRPGIGLLSSALV